MSSEIKHVGNEFSTPELCEGVRRTRDEAGNWTLEKEYWIAESAIASFLPVPGASLVDAICGTLYNFGVEITQTAGTTHKIKLTYKKSPVTDPETGTEIIQESATNRTEKKIEEHPGWSALSEFQQTSLKSFYSTFEVISTTYKRTTRSKASSYTFNEDDVLGNVNSIETPAGLSGATSGKWKNYDKSINYTKKGILETAESWQYDLYDWSGTVTPDSNLASVLAALGVS